MKKLVMIMVILVVCSSASFAANWTDLPLEFEVGAGLSGAVVNFEEQNSLSNILSFLATSRTSVFGTVRYPINEYLAVGGELGAGYMSVTITDSDSTMETQYSVLHLPTRVFVRVGYGELAIDPYIGVNTVYNSFFHPGELATAFEYGAKFHLGPFYFQYSKEKDLQATDDGTKLNYTRYGVGCQIDIF